MEYFKHDINASEDDKICDLLANEGYELLGYYWRFIEYLYSRGGRVYKNKLNSVAWSLHMDVDKLSKMICGYDLFYEDDEFIYSKRVVAEIEEFEAVGKHMAEIGRKGGQASAKAKSEANAQATAILYAQAHGQASAEADGQQNKINKIKEKKEKENNIYNGDKSNRFVPPTLEEVQEYCFERGNNVDAETFVDFYSSKGWMVGKNKMNDWKAAVRTWERKEQKPPNKPQNNGGKFMETMMKMYNED